MDKKFITLIIVVSLILIAITSKVIAESAQFTINLEAGWNSVSSPIGEGIYVQDIKNACGEIIQVNYWTGTSYADEDFKLEAGKGYLVLVHNNCNFTVVGTSYTFYPIEVPANMAYLIGTSSTTKTVEELRGTCLASKLEVTIYDKNTDTHTPVSTIETGKSYWVKNNDDKSCIFGRPPFIITQEYKTVNLEETFSVSIEVTEPYKWEIDFYDKNYLDRTGLLSSVSCGASSGDPEPTCKYNFPFKAIKEGKTTIEFIKVNKNDNSIAEKKLIYVTIVSIIATCTDSDGGKNYYTKGTVAKGSDFRTDFCLVAGGTFRYVNEYYCENNEIRDEVYECPNSCDNGACLSTACGNGICEPSEVSLRYLRGQTTTCPQDCGFEIDPYDADVDYCISSASTGQQKISTTGPQSAAWFIWNNCAKYKYYNVNKGEKLRLHVFTDGCDGCVCYYPNFDVYEYQNGDWVLSKTFDLPDVKSLEQNEYYIANSDKIKIAAKNCFYLDIFSSSSLIKEKPDLKIEKIEYYLDNPTSPTKLHFQVTIRNIGTTSCSFESNIKIPQLSNYQNNNCMHLNPGESCVETGYGYNGLGGTIPSGYYDIIAVVDPRNLVDELNENNNQAERRVFVSYGEEIKIVYLNKPFDLKVGQKAEVVDYRNMIVSLDKLDDVEICPVTWSETGTSQQVCTVRKLATVSMKIPGELAIATKLGPGDTRDTPFGVKIRFDRIVDSNTGIFTVFQETQEFKFAIKPDRYWYSSGESVRIDAILIGDPSINFADARVVTHVIDPNGKRYEVEMRIVGVIAPTCTESITTGTYTCARTNEYHFVGIYNIPSYAPNGLYKVRSTVNVAGITKDAETSFKVGEAYLRGVDVSIRPEIQVTSIGKEVSYKVTIIDKHPVQACPVGVIEQVPISGGAIAEEIEVIPPCPIRMYDYMIGVYGLPYHTVFPEVVSVPAGGSKTFELKIFPSSVRTAQGIATAVSKVRITEAVSAEERAVSITGQQIATEKIGEFEAQPAQVNEALFRFTVKAALREDPTVSDSAIGVLHVRFVQIPEPPPFPEEETIRIELRRGWNLISLPGKGIGFSQGTCSAIQKPLAYIYLQDRKRYATLEEAVRIMGPERLLEYLSTHSFWIYSYEDCDIGFKVTSYSTYSGLPISGGWNLIGTTKDMIGETLSNIKGTCKFERIHTWDSDSQEWVKKTENDLIEAMGYGIVVKASSSCRLGTNIIQPPALPEG